MTAAVPADVTSVRVRVPAKINIVLRVGPRRTDGYHSIATIFHAVSLYDEVVVTRAARTSVTIDGPEAAAAPADDSNLAVRAAGLLAEHAGVPDGDAGVQIHIHKQIPVAAGLAGGSADAAATLVACDQLWRAGARTELPVVAARLGSDIPFALAGGTAVGTGRGERLSPALARGPFHWVLAVSASGLSTPDVYTRADELRDEPSDIRRAQRARHPAAGNGTRDDAHRDDAHREVDAVALAALRSGDPAQLGAALANDLQPAAIALAPALRGVLRAGEEAGALGGIVSGSGPTCVFLARDAAHAMAVATHLSAAGVCRTVRPVSGPVPGARVVR